MTVKAYLKHKIFPENESFRHNWIRKELALISKGSKLLDAGCGTQPYRQECKHLKYLAQDFGAYSGRGNDDALHDGKIWKYGALDYTSNIWSIPEKDATFDAILCTEVFEHIPYPDKALAEFARLLKKGGVVLLTVPVNCIPHQTPYFFFSGFSREWYEKFAQDNGLTIETYKTYSGAANFLAQELLRLVMHYRGFKRVLLAVAIMPYLLVYRYLRKAPEHPCIGALVKMRKK